MSCDTLKPYNRLCGLITAEDWGMLLPDSVIKRTRPSNHKKASLNINISSEHLSKNMTATGLPPLKSVWNWDSTGNSYWFVDWKLFKILPGFSQKDNCPNCPKWTMTIFTIATWLKIETFQARELRSKSKEEEWVNVTVYVLSLGSLRLLSVSPDKIFPLQACQSCDPHGFTHLLSTLLINNDDNNNSKGHKAYHGLWTIHSFDFECNSSLVSFKTGHNSTKNKSQQ